MSKTDKELLELAAKAIGLTLKYNYLGNRDARQEWDPLTDDGDALRLAVDLGIAVRRISNKAMASSSAGQFNEYCDNDKRAATRRAIVRAAAAIGEGMQ